MSAPASPRKADDKPEKPKRVYAEIDESEIPDVIERLPKPDKAAHDSAISKIDAEIKKLQDRSNVIRKEMDALKTGRSGYGAEIQAAKLVYNELRSQKDNLIQQRNQITARLKQSLDKKDSTVKQQKSLRASLKFQSIEEIDAEIAKLVRQQETSSMSLNEEKRLVKDIEALKKSKEQVHKVTQEQGSVDKHNDNIKDIKAEQAKKNAEIDAVQEKMTAQKAKLDKLYELNNEENKQDKFPALAKERKEIKEQVDAKYTELKALRAAFKEANDKYFHNIRLTRKKRELERKKEEEAKRAEYEAKLAEYEQEMAKIHPYQDEMDLCDVLIAYLELTFAKELKESAEEDAAKETAPVELDGLKPLKRKEEDFMVLGGGKKKKGKRDGPKKSKKEAKVALSLARMESFTTIGLTPPSTVGALVNSLSAIKEKKEWFKAQTSKPKAEKEAAAAPAPAASSPKKKGNKKFSAADANAFPSLGGVEAALPQTSFMSWGPGMAPPAPASYVQEEAEEDEVEHEEDEN
ncbi:TPA: hypothetical protein N0F65_006123 [Lagenidium giganteum]|uniref:Nuclear segregation protein n=1 Tax=Lagenidium giganteum TaxID=4803 RepID=A0AAV2Z1S1_9STRA|nr:TPA: hypothetical protein N0F65_006123 [Lagenidium giganteum]